MHHDRDVLDAGERVVLEAIVGGSPYNRTEAELAAFLDTLDAFLRFAVNDLRAAAATFAEFSADYCSGTIAA